MTNIVEIKQVMCSEREKVNNICIYELETIISRADSNIYEVDSNMCRVNTRRKNCGRTSNRKNKNRYWTAAGAEALDLGSVSSMSSRRLSMSGK